MYILAHRGLWKRPEDANSKFALSSAIEAGYGFESDIRDECGDLVISHDIPGNSAIPAANAFEMIAAYGNSYCFAMNIKSDGLAKLLKSSIVNYKLSNYFAFDMSVPQMQQYRLEGIRYFTRQSDFEQVPILYDDANGVWMDSFEDSSWITASRIQDHLANGKQVCIVSPELHGRPHEPLWEILRKMAVPMKDVYLCTDLPNQARRFFGCNGAGEGGMN